MTTDTEKIERLHTEVLALREQNAALTALAKAFGMSLLTRYWEHNRERDASEEIRIPGGVVTVAQLRTWVELMESAE